MRPKSRIALKMCLVLVAVAASVMIGTQAHSGTAAACERLFTAKPAPDFIEIQPRRISLIRNFNVNRPRIELIRVIQTLRGDLYEIRRTGRTWGSDFRSMKTDPQGNPQWPIFFFGAKAAAQLGFRLLNIENDRMTIPSATYLTNALREANGRVSETDKTELLFVDITSKLQDQLTYLAQHAEGFLPIARGETSITTAAHDLTYHTLAVLLPPVVLRESRKITKKTIEFLDFLEKAARGTAYAEDTALLGAQTVDILSKTVDEGTAKFVVDKLMFAKIKRRGGVDPVEGRISPTVASAAMLLGLARVMDNDGNQYMDRMTREFSLQTPVDGMKATLGVGRHLRSSLFPSTFGINAYRVSHFVMTDFFKKSLESFTEQWASAEPSALKPFPLGDLRALSEATEIRTKALIQALEAVGIVPLIVRV